MLLRPLSLAGIRQTLSLTVPAVIRSMSVYTEHYYKVPFRQFQELSDVEFPPERRRLQPLARTPYTNVSTKQLKEVRHMVDIRGVEEVRNKLTYGQYGIQAIGGGELKIGHLEMIRMTINRKLDEKRMFVVWGVEAPWKAKTKRSLGKRMGGGKADIHHFVTPVKAERIIVEMGGYLDWREAYRILSRVAEKLPFPARFISQDLLAMEAKIQACVQELNVNPFGGRRNLAHALANNYAGCQNFISPYYSDWVTMDYR